MAFLLWAMLTLLLVLVTVAVAVVLVQRHESAIDAERAPVMKVLADELAEIERQLSAGTMTSEEANAMKADTRRRILAESREAQREPRRLAPGQARWMALGFAGAIAASAIALYGWMGRPDLAMQSSAPAAQPNGAGQVADADLATLTQRLEARLAESPNDAEGWRLLGGSHFSLGNFDRSAAAYARSLALKPDDVETLSAYGEAQVQAAGGSVSPAARETFRKTLKFQPADVRARYFLAAGLNQDGDAKGAIAAWLDLLKDAPANAQWAIELRQLVAQRAQEAGITIDAPMAQTAPSAPPAPSADQMAAVQAMAPDDQQSMIRGMVDRLDARLQANPIDLEGWQRLIRARMVLGETDKAKLALENAEKAFAARPQDAETIRAFAQENGVPVG